MKAEDLDLQNLFRFSRGLVSLLGRRVVIHDLFAMGQFRRDLVNMVGQEHARRICTRMGYFWGQ
ncbi:XylR N-terminal domain-containing protein, partial [bacterium]|nr:XylR N-terminal domain-containing protein [bacterium]